jgi:hypothetical protein
MPLLQMDKAQLEQLKADSEQRCKELYAQVQEVSAELERTRGDFRTYDLMLTNWPELPAETAPGVPEAEIVDTTTPEVTS